MSVWREVGAGVFVRRYAFYDQNIVAVRGDGEVLVVDTRTTNEHARELIEELRRHPRLVGEALRIARELATEQREERTLQREDEARRLGGRESEPCARSREISEEGARRHPCRIVDVEDRVGIGGTGEERQELVALLAELGRWQALDTSLLELLFDPGIEHLTALADEQVPEVGGCVTGCLRRDLEH